MPQMIEKMYRPVICLRNNQAIKHHHNVMSWSSVQTNEGKKWGQWFGIYIYDCPLQVSHEECELFHFHGHRPWKYSVCLRVEHVKIRHSGRLSRR